MPEELGRQILAGLSELKGEMTAHGIHISALTQQVGKQNGRIGRLEEWRQEVALVDARAAGQVEGRTGLARTQVAVLMGSASAIGALAGLVARFV